MKHLSEYRDPTLASNYFSLLHQITTQPWRIMEACGGQTHSILKNGIDQKIPSLITFVHGPGCPICVTPTSVIDDAIGLAMRPSTILCTFGDMLRVPGTDLDLMRAEALRSRSSKGGATPVRSVKIIYSPLEVLKIAEENPQYEVVFFAVGFETTTPANAMVAFEAKRRGLKNVSLLVSQVLVPPALEALLGTSPASGSLLQGFLAPGHVCTITGIREYETLSKKYNIPIVITGFEPVDILQGLVLLVRQLESGVARVENQYSRNVRPEGNHHAQKMTFEVFEVCDKLWRGLGILPKSGLCLNSRYRDFDARFKFALPAERPESPTQCISGTLLQGLARPADCPEFGKACTPENPLGATMVSGEGVCNAYYRFQGTRDSRI